MGMDLSGEAAKELWHRFWYLRGVLAAFTIISVIPSFTDLSQYQLLRAIHVVIWTWNESMAWIGQLMGHLPWIPELPAHWVNVALLTLSIISPLLALSFIELPKEFGWFRFILFAPFYYPLFFAVYAFPVWMIFEFIVVYNLEFPFELANLDLIQKIFMLILLLSFFVVGLFVIVSAPTIYPVYWKSFFWTISCLLVLELLYVLNAPIIAETIDNFACGRLNLSEDECKTPN